MPLAAWSRLPTCRTSRGFRCKRDRRARNSKARRLKPHDLTEQIHDFADTAALIEQLDLVITVDTSVAHLAGALGKPVWVLLPANYDWRWMLDRDDSPWYPTMRLFKQTLLGDWSTVVAAVEDVADVRRCVTAATHCRADHSFAA